MTYVVFGLLVCVSAFFSSSETALFSIDKVARTRLAQSDRRTDQVIARLLRSPRDLLITVLLGNEVTNVALAVVGARITAAEFEDYSLAAQTVLSAALVLPVLMLFGEITPKTLAARRPEAMARFLARPLSAFDGAVAPLRSLLNRLTGALLRRLDGPQDTIRDPNAINEREFRTLVDVGAEAGIVDTQERHLIHNVLDFGDLTVSDVMVPADRLFALSDKTPVSEAINAAISKSYSRIPIWRSHPSNIVGWVHAKDLLAQRWGVGPPRPLRSLLRKPMYVPRKARAAHLLDRFRQNRIHMAFVVDERGHAIGVCTMEDLLEEVFGPITDVIAEKKGDDA